MIKEIIKDTCVFDLGNIYSKEISEKDNDFRYLCVR
jgi:hypothetical protein